MVKKKRSLGLFVVLVFVLPGIGRARLPAQASPALSRPMLRLLTINVWSGLDYKGSLRFGAYEPRQARQARYRSLLAQVRELDPDVIFMQEVNPAAGFSARLARDLGFSRCHQVCIGGIKFGPVGIPANCKEGNAILARKSLRLQKVEDWKLSGSFGLFGDALTIHFNQAIFALLARIYVDDRPIHLVNVHLVAVPPGADPALEASWQALRQKTACRKKNISWRWSSGGGMPKGRKANCGSWRRICGNSRRPSPCSWAAISISRRHRR